MRKIYVALIMLIGLGLSTTLTTQCHIFAQSNPLPASETSAPSEQIESAPLSTLSLPGFGMEIPILTSPTDLDRHVGHVVAIRGSIGNSKIPHIIGVAVSGGHKLPDACAVGMLAKFVTTEKDWEEQKRLNPNGMGAGSFGPGTRYTLYKSLEGGIADAQEWGTGYTNDQSKIKLPTKSAG